MIDCLYLPCHSLEHNLLKAIKGITIRRHPSLALNEFSNVCLLGTYYVKEILKKSRKKGRVEMLVSWEDWGEKDNTWEPVRNLPPDKVAAFGNHRKKQKTVSSALESDSLQNLLLQEISKRASFRPKQGRRGEHLSRSV